MPFVPAKCTQCGASLQVDSTKEAAICQFCGTPFIVEKAINNYTVHNTIHAGTVIVQGGSRDFDIHAGVLVNYNGPATSVVIPDGVREIGPRVFAGFKYLEEITIPDSVEAIAPDAFKGTDALRTINMSDSQWKKFYSFFSCLENEKQKQIREEQEQIRKEKMREVWRSKNLCQYDGKPFSLGRCSFCCRKKDY